MTTLSANIWYSSDGQSWNYSPGSPFPGGDGSGYSVAYDGSGKWVAVGDGNYSGNNILYSTNGINWTAASGSPFGGYGGIGKSVAYRGGKWVAVGDGNGSGNNIWYSSDGQSWTAATATASGPIFGTGYGYGNSVVFANGKWVALGNGYSTKNVWYSTNGITWTAASGFPFSYPYGKYVPTGNSVVYDGIGKWVAVGYSAAKTPPIPPKPKPTTYIDLSKFLLPTCPSSLRIDSIEGRLLTASILDFKEGIYYAFYVDGNKVLNNIQTSTFQYTFPFPGKHNLYITCSDIPTNNSAQKTLPKNIVSVFII